MPTWEKFCERASKFISDELVSIFGYVKDANQNTEIKGIAVFVLKTLLLIAGMPATGKTTFAEYLSF